MAMIQARIERAVNGLLSHTVELPDAPPVVVPLHQTVNGFVPSQQVAEWGRIATMTVLNGDVLEVIYTNGERSLFTRHLDFMWLGEAPLPPPPTITKAQNIVVLQKKTNVTRFTYTASGPVTVTTSAPSHLTVTVSGTSITVRAGNTTGKFTVTYTVLDQWGRTVSSAFVAHVPRLPTVSQIANFTMIQGVTRLVNFTYTAESGVAVTTAVRAGITAVRVGSQIRVVSKSTPGRFTVRYTVTDTWGQKASKTFVVTVLKKPTMQPVGPFTINVGTSHKQRVIVTGEKPFTWSVTTSNAAVMQISVSTNGYITLRAKGRGVARMSVTARDKYGQTVTRSFNATGQQIVSWMHPLGGTWPWTTYSDGAGSHSAGALDFPAAGGTPIFAPTSGTILLAGWEDGGGGNTIILSPDSGAGEGIGMHHLSGFNTSTGAWVAAGQVIGYVGTTGSSSGNHLHLEVRVNGTVWGSWYRALDYFAARGIVL